jgi:LysM domain.
MYMYVDKYTVKPGDTLNGIAQKIQFTYLCTNPSCKSANFEP